MMDEDFYIEESNPVKVFFSCLIILFIVGGLFGAYYYFSKDAIKLQTITVELGDKVPDDIKLYLKTKDYANYSLDISSVHVDEDGRTDSVGEYSYRITNGTEIKRGKIFVKDTIPPEVELQELTVGLNEEFEVDDFIISCKDLSETCYIEYNDPDDETLSENEGTYDLTLKIEDKYGNKVTKKAKLTVDKNASLNDLKAKDLEPFNIYPIDESWNKTYTVKFEKGISEEDESFESKLLDLTNEDFSEKYKTPIINHTILTIYNKYGYVLGFSVKLEFENEEIIYVTR